MLQGIDHLVIAGADLDALSATFRRLGFHVEAGGRHGQCSYNSLIGLQDGSYIELLSFYEYCPQHPWWQVLQSRGGGFIDYCMRTDDIHGDFDAFVAQGVALAPLVTMGRRRVDGLELQWMNNKLPARYQGLLPFIITDITPRAQRVPVPGAHRNRVTGIASVTLATTDLDAAAGIMAAVLQQPGQAFEEPGLQAHGVAFHTGAHRLEYICPADSASPLHAQLQRHSPLPWRIRFKTAGTPRVFTPAQAANARIELV